MFYRRMIHLLAPDGDGGAGGGTPKKSQDGGAGNSLTEEHVKDIVNESLNGAMKNVVKRTAKLVTDALTGEDSPIVKQMAELKEAVTAKGKEKPAATKAADEPAQSEEYKALTKRLEKLESENTALKNERESGKKKALADKQFEALVDSLSKSGFKSRARYVAKDLVDKVTFDGADPNTGTLGDALIKNKDGVEVSLSEYLSKEYIHSEDGKAMMDAPSRSGSGSGEQDRSPGFTPPDNWTPDQVSSMSDEEILKSLPIPK